MAKEVRFSEQEVLNSMFRADFSPPKIKWSCNNAAKEMRHGQYERVVGNPWLLLFERRA